MYVYRSLGTELILCEGLGLGAVQQDEIDAIRVWRNQQKEILRQKEDITVDVQQKYFEDFVWSQLEFSAPSQLLLSIYSDNLLIGYGGLVHISWEHFRAEISFLTNTQISEGSKQYVTLFSRFLKAMQTIAHDKLGLHKLTLETYEMRSQHITTIESAGFVREGTLIDHVLVNEKWMNSILHGKVIG